MKTRNGSKPAAGRSASNGGLCLARIQKMRDETAATCEDMVLSDGTIMISKEQGLVLVAKYDELLGELKHQDGAFGADPKYPSSCCAPQSFGQ
jgi:hypothetical protein